MKTIAICHLRGRVAPRCDFTEEFLIVTFNNEGSIIEKKVLIAATLKPSELAKQLSHQYVEVLICGGVKEDWQEILRKNNIQVIDNVIGDVEKVFIRYTEDKLRPGNTIF